MPPQWPMLLRYFAKRATSLDCLWQCIQVTTVHSSHNISCDKFIRPLDWDSNFCYPSTSCCSARRYSTHLCACLMAASCSAQSRSASALAVCHAASDAAFWLAHCFSASASLLCHRLHMQSICPRLLVGSSILRYHVYLTSKYICTHT